MQQFDNSVPIQIASIAIVTVVILSAPLVLWPMRQALDTLIFRGWKDLYMDLSWPTRLRYFGLTVVLVGVTYTINAVVGDLKVVFGLTGAIGATVIKVIVPSAVYLKIGHSSPLSDAYETISPEKTGSTSVNPRLSSRSPLIPRDEPFDDDIAAPPDRLALWEKLLCSTIILFGTVCGGVSTYVVIAKAIGDI